VKCSEMCEGCVAVSYYRCLEDKNLCNISYKVFTPCVCVCLFDALRDSGTNVYV